jgi:DNA polymerase III subunit chi
VTEILFYQLKGQRLEDVLPPLIARCLDRGWRVAVQASSEERIDALDAHLWTWRDDAFLPHGTWRDAEASVQPVLLTVKDENPNEAVVRFLIEGAGIPADPALYQRLVLIFDGADPEAVEEARQRWSRAKADGFEVTYWRANENGGWQREA